MSSSVHIDNKENDVLILGEGSTDGLDHTTLTAEKEYYVNFTEQQKNLHYNESKSYTFVNGVEMNKFKAKDSEINTVLFCLGNVAKYFSVHNMKKTGLYGYVYDFSVNDDVITGDDILDIHNYLIKKGNIK